MSKNKKAASRKEHLKVIENGNGISLADLCDDAWQFMMQIFEDEGRKLDVFKDPDDGNWYVDMTQFKDLENSHTIDRKTRSLDMIDRL